MCVTSNRKLQQPSAPSHTFPQQRCTQQHSEMVDEMRRFYQPWQPYVSSPGRTGDYTFCADAKVPSTKNPKPKFPNLKSDIWNLKLNYEFWNSCSEIWDPKFEFWIMLNGYSVKYKLMRHEISIHFLKDIENFARLQGLNGVSPAQDEQSGLPGLVWGRRPFRPSSPDLSNWWINWFI